jgi:aspartate racemase
MKTIGLIGGLTWLSTVEYYSIINRTVNERLGGVHSAKIALQSLDFGQIKDCIDRNDWRTIADLMVTATKSLELSGAECIVFCANTAHKVAGEVRAATRLPLIHIAEETAKALKEAGITRAGLLGTRFTMMDPFFRDELTRVGIETLVPESGDRDFIHSSILDEMAKGIFLPSTKARYLDILETLTRDGAEGIIEGCTEIPLLIKPDDCTLPLFNTTEIHAIAAVDFALG